MITTDHSYFYIICHGTYYWANGVLLSQPRKISWCPIHVNVFPFLFFGLQRIKIALLKQLLFYYWDCLIHFPVLSIFPLLTLSIWYLLNAGLSSVIQVPVIQFLLGQVGLVSGDQMLSIWRYVVVGAVVAAAVLTPSTDPLTQCLLAAPLLGLYLGGAWVVKLSGRWAYMFHQHAHIGCSGNFRKNVL